LYNEKSLLLVLPKRAAEMGPLFIARLLAVQLKLFILVIGFLIPCQIESQLYVSGELGETFYHWVSLRLCFKPRAVNFSGRNALCIHAISSKTVFAPGDTVLVAIESTVYDITAHAFIASIPAVLKPITDIFKGDAARVIIAVKYVRVFTVAFISKTL